MRGVRTAAVAAVLVAGALPATPAAAAAPFQIRPLSSRWCLDVDYGKPDNGTKIQLWTCVQGSQQELWNWRQLGNDIVQVVNAKTNKCLDVKWQSPDDRAVVHQWECFSSLPSQQWRYESVIGRRGWPDGYQLINVNSGKCLAYDPPANGAAVFQATCGGRDVWDH